MVCACSLSPDECKSGETRVKHGKRELCSGGGEQAYLWREMNDERLPLILSELYVKDVEKNEFYLNDLDGISYRTASFTIENSFLLADFSLNVKPDSNFNLIGIYKYEGDQFKKIEGQLDLKMEDSVELIMKGSVVLNSTTMEVDIRPLVKSAHGYIAQWGDFKGIPGIAGKRVVSNAE
jgi:hypothetical protein